MGRKFRKKKHLSITDHLLFKILSALIMIAAFVVLYYVVVMVVERPGLALTCTVPCALLLIWIAIKQRLFWWIWLIGAVPCVVLMILFRFPPLSIIFETTYWVISFAMCQWLIWAPSRARSHMLKRKKTRARHHNNPDEPAAPRPRDELLEKLFAEGESQ